MLTPCFIDSHGHRVGQVQAAAAFTHGQPQAMLAAQRVENIGGQATALRAEQKGIAWLKARIMKRPRAFGGEGKQPRVAYLLQTACQVSMCLQRGILVIVEPGTAQALVVQLETQGFDQMQGAAAVGA